MSPPLTVPTGIVGRNQSHVAADLLAAVETLRSTDVQLICYSWISGIPDVAFIISVRKQAPENQYIQYLKATISEEQRRKFARLVKTTIRQLESGHFSSYSGIRFPQSGCVSCCHLGRCLGNQQLIETNLIRWPGASDLTDRCPKGFISTYTVTRRT